MTRAAVRTVRLASGLVLLTYLATHLANHALGLVSVQAMEGGRAWFLLLWRSPVGTVALYGALLVHAALALWRLWDRRHLRMPAWETTQTALGLVIPPLLAGHIVGTRIAYEAFGVQDEYARVLFALWDQAPERGARQALVLLLAWVHGAMGVHYWLRFRPWYRTAQPWLFAVALLLPVLALLGFAHGGRAVTALARGTPDWTAALARRTNAPGVEARATLAAVESGIVTVYGALIGLVLAGRLARGAWRRRYRSVRVFYPGDRVVTVPVGATVLEASRLGGIPHVSVCGGRGRCSTCRVRVVRGLDTLPPAAEAEVRVLRRVGAAPDVRLACQTRLAGDLAVAPLLAGRITADQALAVADPRQGRERVIAVLFADLRGFTSLAEEKLPYDVVFVLNRYFETVGTAVTRAGGITNQFTGDGMMALFGVDDGPEAGCRQALEAARAMVAAVARLSEELRHEVGRPLRIGIGIHAGPAVVGQMGWGDTFYLTAVGDTVHVASRLEQATKDHAAELVVSEEVARHAGVSLADFPTADLAVRNRAGRVTARIVARVAELPVPLAATPSATGR